jgi:hypothetical protein
VMTAKSLGTVSTGTSTENHPLKVSRKKLIKRTTVEHMSHSVKMSLDMVVLIQAI